MTNFSVRSGTEAAFFCLEPEPTQFDRSRSRLRDLGISGAGAAQKGGGSASIVICCKL